MKKIVALLFAVSLLCPAPAVAEVARGSASAPKVARSMTARKTYYNWIAIYFRWGVCRTSYRAKVPYPSVIRGYACGTYVSCRYLGNRRYRCLY